jgi:hypothetical protein
MGTNFSGLRRGVARTGFQDLKHRSTNGYVAYCNKRKVEISINNDNPALLTAVGGCDGIEDGNVELNQILK